MKYLVVDKNSVRSNLRAVRQRAGSAIVIADLTADACGLGLVETARILRDDGVRAFAVSETRDAAALRKSGFVDERIMMLRGTADTKELETLVDCGVVCTVSSHDDAVALNGIAESRKTVCEVQIKLDTGFGRYGFLPEETDKVESIFKYMPNLAVVGMFSSLYAPWKSKSAASEQLRQFREAVARVTDAGFAPGILHICDDCALFQGIAPMDAVRIGPALTGWLPGSRSSELSKAAYIAAGAEEIRWQPQGSRVCGRRLSAAKKTAVVSVGWYHGFGTVYGEDCSGPLALLRAHRAGRSAQLDGGTVRVLGRPGMTHTVLDVTGIPCAIGAEVRLEVNPMLAKGLPRLYR
jgi:alanine racemase